MERLIGRKAQTGSVMVYFRREVAVVWMLRIDTEREHLGC